MYTAALEQEIRIAFKNVQLEGGIGIRQAKAIDNFGEGLTDREFFELKLKDEADRWEELTPETLEEYHYISHLDAKGFRFAIPAYMLSLLADGEFRSSRGNATLSALYPKKDELNPTPHQQYSLLTRPQRVAIGHFLQAILDFETLAGEERKVVERAIRNYWHQFL